MRAFTAVQVVARRPHVDGPFVANRFACPTSNLLMEAPRFELDSSFNESFTGFDGKARVTTQRVIAGANGLAAMTGNVSFTGTPKAAYGKLDVAAQRSRLGPIYADRTRIDGRYLIGAAAGTLTLLADYSAENADLAPSVMASVTEPLVGGEEHADRADRRRDQQCDPQVGEWIRRLGLDPDGQLPRRRSGADRNGGSPGQDRRKGPRIRRRRRHLLLAQGPPPGRRPDRDGGRRPSDRARSCFGNRAAAPR